MDESKTDETCDKCKEPFKILIADFEQTMKDGDPILCPDCETKALEEQAEAEKPPKRCFEYNRSSIKECDLTECGKLGWELITIHNGDAYFKREYLGELL